MLRFVLIVLVFACLPVRAGERHAQAELLLDTIAVWGQSAVEDFSMVAVDNAIQRTGQQHGFIAYLSFEMNEGKTWGCYQKAAGQTLCQKGKESLKRVTKADQAVWFEWTHEGTTYLEYAIPFYLSENDGTQLLSGVWRLGVVVER